MCPPSSTLAASRSTVTPGQLPTRADAPVTRLKNVDLPVFGMPTSATRFMAGAATGSAVDQDRVRVPAAEDHVGGAEPHVQRPLERAAPDQAQRAPGAQAQGRQALPQAARRRRRRPRWRRRRGGVR